MSDWQCKLDLKDVWNKYPDEIEIQELCKIVAKRLRELKPPAQVMDERDNIADEYEIMSIDKDLTVEEFDNIMQDLYDWGDISLDNKFGGKKVCWIATNF